MVTMMDGHAIGHNISWDVLCMTELLRKQVAG
jgi:hypothetical protein